MKKWHVLVTLLMVFCVGVWQAAAFDGTDFSMVKKLAEEGNPEAQMKLGVMYSSGLGMPLDKKEGLVWYQKSADQGYAPGQWNLAFVYVKGELVPEDFAKAFQLFTKAAEQGLDSAQYDLGMMYLQGLGTPADRAQAEKWFNRAVAQGNRDARKILKELAAEAEKSSAEKK